MSTQPPFGDATDEAVSAFLDDELDDFAAAHDTTVDDVRNALAAWPGFEARRRELEHARGALATTTASLDELDRRRLVQRAVTAAGPGRRRQPAWRWAAVAAAVIVVLGAAGFGLSQLGGGNSSSAKKSASSAAGPRIPAGAYVGDVGEIANTTVLRTLLSQQQAGLPLHAQGEFANPAAGSSADQNRTLSAEPPPSPAPTATNPAQAAAASAAAARCAGTVAGRDPVTFLATATYQGRAVVVVGVHRGARTVGFVLDRTTCVVVTAESL